LIVALFLGMSLWQTERLSFYYQTLPLFRIYFWSSIFLILVAVFFWIRMFLSHQSFIPSIIRKFRSLSIPTGAKVVIALVLITNLLFIASGSQRYPFYDVGMFRWAKDFKDRDKIEHELKYYYLQKGQYKILELRKEASFFLAEYFGLGYSNDFTYSTAYFHKGETENFQFLSRAMKERGVDTLWVGVHTVNFETRVVIFDPDICNAIKINQTADLYYGPIYIPDYQLKKCNEN